MTYIIIIVTAIISVIAFSRGDILDKMMLNPYQVFHRTELYRMITHGFLHSDWTHLIINMFVLYFFGRNVENWFRELKLEGYINSVTITYSLLYFGGIIISSLITLFRYRNDRWYNSVGASGAVSAVVFTSIFFSPLERIYFFGVIPIPGIVFAIIYLIYSSYMSRRSKDNINHDAHFLGAVYGLLFPVLISMDMLTHFIRGLGL